MLHDQATSLLIAFFLIILPKCKGNLRHTITPQNHIILQKENYIYPKNAGHTLVIFWSYTLENQRKLQFI